MGTSGAENDGTGKFVCNEVILHDIFIFNGWFSFIKVLQLLTLGRIST